jgi:CBS domain-containing protein
MTLQDILHAKGSTVYSIEPHATLKQVVERLVEFGCGSLLVCAGGVRAGHDDAGGLLGIITERDIVRACARRRGSIDQLRVAEVMSSDVITGHPGDSVEDTMGLMTERRMRHLPIVEDGRLVGLVSIGDVVKAQHALLATENQFLKSYIHG